VSVHFSEHTSIKRRVDHVQAQSRTDDLAATRGGSVAGSAAAAGMEESLWLRPIEVRRGMDSLREGMIEGFSLGNYLLLVDHTGRLFREVKATISQEVAEILQRIGSSGDSWQARLEQLKRRGGRLLGRFFAVTRATARCCEAVRRAPPGQPGRLPGRLSEVMSQLHCRHRPRAKVELHRSCRSSASAQDHVDNTYPSRIVPFAHCRSLLSSCSPSASEGRVEGVEQGLPRVPSQRSFSHGARSVSGPAGRLHRAGSGQEAPLSMRYAR
jgi:hypothetical protein